MEHRALGRSGLRVSKIGLGTWGLGGDFYGPVGEDAAIDTVRAAIDSGVNLIDTAPAYGDGRAEELVGRALNGLRDSVLLATKVGIVRKGKRIRRCLEPQSIRTEIEGSLRRLKVEAIDLYQIHWPDPDTPLEQTMETLLRIRDEGKVRHLGVSNFDQVQLEQTSSLGRIESFQPYYSLLGRAIEEDGTLDFCREHEIGVLCYGALGGGVLTGKFGDRPSLPEGDHRHNFYPYFAEQVRDAVARVLREVRAIARVHGAEPGHVAAAWAADSPGITSALIGAKSVDQVSSNALAGELVLSPEERERLDRASEAIEEAREQEQ